MEGRRAIVGEQLSGEASVDRVGEFASFFEVGLGGFAPKQVGVRCVGQAAGNGCAQSTAIDVEPVSRALAGEESQVVLVVVAGDKASGVGVGARNEHGRYAHGVGSEARSDQLLNGLLGRHQNFAAEVPALFGGG